MSDICRDCVLMLKPDWTPDGEEQQYLAYCTCGKWRLTDAETLMAIRKQHSNHVANVAARKGYGL